MSAALYAAADMVILYPRPLAMAFTLLVIALVMYARETQ